MPKKILIMVLSYNAPPFDLLMRTQMETWDATEVEGVSTIYYHGGERVNTAGATVDEIIAQVIHHNTAGIYFGPHRRSWRLGFQHTDSYYFMAGKFKEALGAAFKTPWAKDFDIIFRTNSSSYVNIKKLKEFAENLPTEKLYAGWEIQGAGSFNVVSGAGIFLSRDVAEILMNEIDPLYEKEEDCYIAEIISRHPEIKIIDDKSREDIGQIVMPYVSLDRYHYRFKTDNRIRDANNMRYLHQKITINE